jgi:hypothetical protein
MWTTHFEPGAAERAARITAYAEKVDWAKMSLRLERYAFRCTGRRSKEVAMEAAQTAISQVLDPKYMEWDPAKVPDLYEHLKNVTRGVLSNRRQLRSTRGEIGVDAEDLARIAKSSDKSPESALGARRLAAAVTRRLTDKFADDPLVTAVIQAMAEGVTTPRDLVEATGASADEVRNARRRIAYVTGEIAKELGLNQETGDVR